MSDPLIPPPPPQSFGRTSDGREVTISVPWHRFITSLIRRAGGANALTNIQLEELGNEAKQAAEDAQTAADNAQTTANTAEDMAQDALDQLAALDVGTIATATIDFGSTPINEAQFTVTDANVTATSYVHAYLMADSTADNDVDAHLHAAASWKLSALPAAGSFTLYVYALEGLCFGTFKVRYSVA